MTLLRIRHVGAVFGVAAVVFLLTIAPGPAAAHESRPLYIEVAERENGLVAVRWRTPPSVPAFNLPSVELSGCVSASLVGTTNTMAGPTSQQLYNCDALGGAQVIVDYPLMNPTVSTLLRLNRASGESWSSLAGPKETAIELPAAATSGAVAKEYFWLGVEHILSGYDHLLFVVCLMLIAGTPRRMLTTITGFTVAHSITLALAALGMVRIPVPPVEAVIALSIVFLATELARNRKGTLTWRFPIAVSSSFGLLHGFGFASVLGEIGVPSTEVPAALFSFNVGAEAGQIAFVVATTIMFQIGRWLWQRVRDIEISTATVRVALERPTGYAVGVLSAFWFVDRINGFL